MISIYVKSRYVMSATRCGSWVAANDGNVSAMPEDDRSAGNTLVDCFQSFNRLSKYQFKLQAAIVECPNNSFG